MSAGSRRQLRLLALPRGENPYQRLLYGALCRPGDAVRYVGELTPSHTMNVLLLPAELAVLRARGWRTLHLHWVFPFRLTGSDRFPSLRWIAQRWFSLVLCLCGWIGVRIVWTAHNVLPHDPVFADDRDARRQLVARADLVLVHSAATLEALEELVGARCRRAAVVEPGPLNSTINAESLRVPGTDGPPLRLLFFGQLHPYKGVEELLTALPRVPSQPPVTVVVAGRCTERDLAERLRALARVSPHQVELRLEWIPDSELAELLSDADVVVLPYRRITTSSSLMLAMGYGRPVLIPDLPAFAELPEDAVIRYDGSVEDLARSLAQLARDGPERLAAVGAGAMRYAASWSWERAARQTRDAIEALS